MDSEGYVFTSTKWEKQMKKTYSHISFEKVLNFTCVIWILLHIYVIWFLPFSIDKLKIIHLGFACVILFSKNFLQREVSSKLFKKILLFLAIIMLFFTVYFFIDYENMAERIGTPSTSDTVIGTIWIAFLVHVAMAWTNNLTALKYHPEIHLIKNGK